MGGQAEETLQSQCEWKKEAALLSDALSPNPGGSLFVHQC